MLLTGGDGQRFRFDAGTLCLEFLLSGAVEPWELLREPADLAAWVPLTRLGIEGPVTVGRGDLTAARRLRAAIWRLAVRSAGAEGVPGVPAPIEDPPEDPIREAGPPEGPIREAGPPEGPIQEADLPVGGGEDDLRVLNAAASAPPPVPVIGAGLERGWAYPVTASQFLSAVARDAIDLFSGPRAARVRMCAGGNCYLIFLDTSRPGARRWCSMSRCGNRQKLRTRRS
ncbi:CGNR zinc finger domain-containing protein [Nonomuraea sp. SMC257]|uniref:CGNR zinc finger domain-containing protein n=2 Tax=Nonomuraea montanisoli TaxID=2741721 RepID=A0A7Y6M8V6_9ACTN|nr:CGNR zinc finger domain-containing protein [Nonomuraea montanisoli]